MTPSIGDLEETGYALWCAADEAVVDGWTVRASGGFTRRINSATATGAPSTSRATHRRLEAWFAERSIPFVIRVTPLLAPEVVETVRDGWRLDPVDPTPVMIARLGNERPADAVEVVDATDEGFLALVGALDGRGAHHVPDYRRITSGPGASWAGLRIGEDAVGLVAVRGTLSAVFSVAVRPASRRGGLATAVMGSARAWAHDSGAEHQFLQVVGTNTAAIRLYEGLGYRTAYEYSYLEA